MKINSARGLVTALKSSDCIAMLGDKAPELDGATAGWAPSACRNGPASFN